jgi:hypothetical protein
MRKIMLNGSLDQDGAEARKLMHKPKLWNLVGEKR